MLSFDEVFKYARVIILSRKDLSEIENNSFIFFLNTAYIQNFIKPALNWNMLKYFSFN